MYRQISVELTGFHGRAWNSDLRDLEALARAFLA
jgi:hypothetical protein